MNQNNTTDRLPPHSDEGEEGVLGCCLLNADCIDDCQATFKAGCKVFYDIRRRKLYEVLCQMRGENKPIDEITVIAECQSNGTLADVGGLEYLALLPSKVPSASNIAYYIKIVWEKYQLARLVRTCTRTVELIQSKASDDARTLIGKLQNGFYDLHVDESDTSDGDACSKGLAEELERRYNQSQAGIHSGLITGIGKLDELTDGIQFKELSIIAARPSIGKTAIGLTMLNRVCLLDEVPTLFITLEMSRDALMRRLFCLNKSVPMPTARTGNFTKEQHQAFSNFCAVTLKQRPIYVHDGVKGMNIDQVSAVVRRYARKHGVKLVIGDYVQRVKSVGKHEKRAYEVGEVSTTLKSLAVDTDTAQLWLCRVNRESEKNKSPNAPDSPPKLSHLSDSGQIEYDADFIGLLHRDKFGEKPNETTLYVAKQRDGELGVINLNFAAQFCRFENAQP